MRNTKKLHGLHCSKEYHSSSIIAVVSQRLGTLRSHTSRWLQLPSHPSWAQGRRDGLLRSYGPSPGRQCSVLLYCLLFSSVELFTSYIQLSHQDGRSLGDAEAQVPIHKCPHSPKILSKFTNLDCKDRGPARAFKLQQ